MLTPHDIQDAQRDAIRTWVTPHFPSNLSLNVHMQLYVPLSCHPYSARESCVKFQHSSHICIKKIGIQVP